jgi:putative Ca2+/H+ antiporter (TMEM165/GDT1 family)
MEGTMDWKVLLTTFSAIFIAELGDKTQLAAISMVADKKSPVAVWIGSILAFGVVTLVGVLIGGGLTKVIPSTVIHTLAGGLFIAIGVLMMMGKF